MTNLQIAIISILYKNQGEPIDKTKLLKRNSLAFWGLVYSEDEIEQDFWRLIEAEYIQYFQPGSRKVVLTELGIDYYKWELNSRKDEENRKREISAREENLYKAQLANIQSTIQTNESIEKTNEVVRQNTQDQAKLSRQTIWFIGISAVISFIGVIFNILQYNNKSKVSIEQLDSLNRTIQKLELFKIVYVKDSTQSYRPSKK
jgi:hypothetical protein